MDIPRLDLHFQRLVTQSVDPRIGIWKIIRGWLDPVVASKINFTSNLKELETYISSDNIIKEIEGKEDWEYQYVEPLEAENDKMKDSATRDTLLAARELLYAEYEEATIDWIKNHEGEEGQAIKARRDDIAKRLRADYWVVDPYIRARSFYDRTGVLGPGGHVEYYPKPAAASVPQLSAPETNGTASTAPDDVD
jgi:hypothetical protein